MDTVERRWRRLAEHVVELGPPDDERRPAVLLFHGCGGVRDHLRRYARAAVQAGCRAFLIDSFGPRGWSKRFAQYLVCTGVALRGPERAGDVLAAVAGVRANPRVDPDRIVLAGWSHGSWTIMDAMSAPLDRPGEARLADPDPEPLDAVKAVFLAYPYVGLISRSRALWRRTPRTFAVAPRRDHLGSIRTHMLAYASAVAAGADVEIWSPDATHAFDEPGIKARLPIAYDETLSLTALERFGEFLGRTLR